MSKQSNPISAAVVNAHANPANAPIPRFKSWVSVYHVFMAIADKILELPEGIDHDSAHHLIANCVDSLYAQHTGEAAWDIAYIKWNEPADEEVPYDD